jgi:hypothetical protein
VVRNTRAKQYWHFDLAGEHTIEEVEPIADDVESVTCRWCGAGDSVEIVARASDG